MFMFDFDEYVRMFNSSLYVSQLGNDHGRVLVHDHTLYGRLIDCANARFV